MKRHAKWKWFAWGKHPGLEDFVWAGTKTPLFQRFTKWVDNGFAKFNTGSKLRSRHCSWRFWTQGTGDQVVCGLVRNSCDAHGRSFPMIHIGTGSLEDWAQNCSLLPYAFESVWKGFEYAASARFETNRQLTDSLQLIQEPEPDWRKYQQRLYDRTDMSYNVDWEEASDGEKKLLKIDCNVPENLPRDMHFCKHVTSQSGSPSPLAVFIGEINNSVAVAMINNALTPADFGWLWTLDRNGQSSARAQEAMRG